MVPEKHQRVGQNVAPNVTQSASKVGEAAAFDAAEFDLIQSCLGKPITLTDAKDSLIKATTKWKKKCSAKEQDQSWVRWWETSSESDSMARHPMPNPAKAQPEWLQYSRHNQETGYHWVWASKVSCHWLFLYPWHLSPIGIAIKGCKPRRHVRVPHWNQWETEGAVAWGRLVQVLHLVHWGYS